METATTHITLTPNECVIRFREEALLTFRECGSLIISNGTVSFSFEPSRLRRNQSFAEFRRETVFSTQKIEITERLTLNIIIDGSTDGSEKLRLELFFQERFGETCGCYITKETQSAFDWSIRFMDADRFLQNLSYLFAVG